MEMKIIESNERKREFRVSGKIVQHVAVDNLNRSGSDNVERTAVIGNGTDSDNDIHN